MTIQVSNKRRLFEIVAVVITGLGKLLFVDYFDFKFVYILTVILFWLIYIILSVRKNKLLIRYWGFSLSTSKETFRITGGIGLVIICGFIIYALVTGTFKVNWHVLFVLITYPIWGLMQQFLMMSLFAGNIKDYTGKKIDNYLVILFTSILFSIVHYPTLPLIAATFLMAIFYSVLFLRYRNIIPLGIFHGILGGLFYYFILNRDPWLEFIKMVNK